MSNTLKDKACVHCGGMSHGAVIIVEIGKETAEGNPLCLGCLTRVRRFLENGAEHHWGLLKASQENLELLAELDKKEEQLGDAKDRLLELSSSRELKDLEITWPQ